MLGGSPRWKVWVRKSGHASAGDHGIAVSGNAEININASSSGPPRSGYLHRVRQVFPGVLVGREAEWTELAAFGTAEEGPAYVWWQGEAWAGKTALMASFVLDPPPGVRVVSFFITARWAGQSDRAAFLEAVLPQLAEITGESLPDVLTETHRQEWFLRLMDEAARVCGRAGARLVLLVDGLDEDRGVTTGPDAHSIAALLPAVPSHGARVIVAGRPNPPIPADVPQWHPLNDARILRRLSPSPAAQVARREAERELVHLVDDGGLGRDLLGLLAAAGGGLSAKDLAELTGASRWKIERVLQAVTGRTFTGRDSTWHDGAGPVFVLAHEELQQTALHCLSDELDRWRDRLHAWADSYGQRGWPAETPEYLLRGYLRMLYSVGDLLRMVPLATDQARLDRMLDVSGGDATALADITTIQEYIRDQPHPDLAASLRLAYARQDLIWRNSKIPTNLPAAWAVLGNLNRAEALTQSITDPNNRVMALASLSQTVAKSGDANRANSFLDEAETLARSIINPHGYTLASLCAVITKTGDLDRAENFVHSISDSDWKDSTLARLATAFAGVGDLDRAKTVASSSSEIRGQASALASVAQAVAKTGDIDRARSLADDATALARSITDDSKQAWALASVAQAVAEIGDIDRARSLADDATALARSITDDSKQSWVLAFLPNVIAKIGDLDRAEAIARSIPGGFRLASALRSLSNTVAEIGDLDRAEAIARSISDASQQTPALLFLSEIAVEAGNLDRAEAIARSIIDSNQRESASALASVAQAVAKTGDVDRARSLADDAEATARCVTDASEQSLLPAWLSKAVMACGDIDRAEAFARSITHPQHQASVLASVAEAVAKTGDVDRARSLADDVEALALSITDVYDRSWALASMSKAVMACGDIDRAEAFARSITHPQHQASALASVAEAVAKTGDVDRARSLADDIEGITRSGDPDPLVLESLSWALAKVGDLDRAEAIAHSITHPYRHGSALMNLSKVVAERGNLVQAEAIARSIPDPREKSHALTSISKLLAEANDPDKAKRLLAESLITTDPVRALPALAAVEPSATVIAAQHFSRS